MALATFLTQSCSYSFPYWRCKAKAPFWYSKTAFFDDIEPSEHYGKRITINMLPSCRAQKKKWNVGTHHISINLISFASWNLVSDDKTDVCTILMYFVNLFHMKIMTIENLVRSVSKDPVHQKYNMRWCQQPFRWMLTVKNNKGTGRRRCPLVCEHVHSKELDRLLVHSFK